MPARAGTSPATRSRESRTTTHPESCPSSSHRPMLEPASPVRAWTSSASPRLTAPFSACSAWPSPAVPPSPRPPPALPSQSLLRHAQPLLATPAAPCLPLPFSDEHSHSCSDVPTQASPGRASPCQACLACNAYPHRPVLRLSLLRLPRLAAPVRVQPHLAPPACIASPPHALPCLSVIQSTPREASGRGRRRSR